MTSILTNNGAMVALQTLKSINNDLGTVQEQISTGKEVGSAKDNAAIWSISKTMETDVSAFKVINDSLGVAESTVGVGMAGAERVTDLLNQMKDLAASAMTDGTDFTKVQTEITAKASEIGGVINGSQMNGINLLKGTNAFEALASLDRTAGSATTTANKISVTAIDLETKTGISLDAATGTLTNGIPAITDTATAATALAAIETALEAVIGGAADLGSAAKNIGSQREFVGQLSDSLQKGIGSLVDADMEEASARLKALQTQQQLGVQSLSIANQAPGAIMSLFR